MPLTFTPDRVADYPVRVKLLDPEHPGATIEHEFTARWRLLRRNEMRDWARKLSEASANLMAGSVREALQSAGGDVVAEYEQAMRERLIGWGEDLTDPAGQPIAFSEAARDALYQEHALAAALDRSLWAASRDEPAKK